MRIRTVRSITRMVMDITMVMDILPTTNLLRTQGSTTTRTVMVGLVGDTIVCTTGTTTHTIVHILGIRIGNSIFCTFL